MPELDPRKQQVLKAVVDDYTVTAIPVGSQSLAARYFARWSAATIRNELASLMESGHLEQPHTSAGRIPSDRGYRYFVDFLMQAEAVDEAVADRLQRQFASIPRDLEAILETTAMALAQAVDNVSVVSAPRTSEGRLKHLDLVHLEERRVLALLVLEGNVVRQQPVEVEAEIDQDELTQLSARLNIEARGKSAAELIGLAGASGWQAWQAAVLLAVAELIDAVDAQSATVVIHDGLRNLVRQPEFMDHERLLPVLELLEESRELARVLESVAAADGVEFLIGDENLDAHLRGCSLVLSTYTAAHTRGTIGTIGPTRVRYPQVVARLRMVAELASASIGRLYQ